MTSRRLQVLSLASAYPYPPTGGTRILIFQQVREMSRHHDVDVVAVDCGKESDFDSSGLPDCRSIATVAIPEPERGFSLAEKVSLTLKTGYPFYLYQRYSSEAQLLVDQRLARRRYDVVIAEDNEAGLYVRRAHPGLKVL